MGLIAVLDPRGPVAREIAELWWFMFWLGVAVFVLFAVLLAGALFRRRGTAASIPPEPADDAPRRWLVGGGVILPLVVLIAVFGFTVKAMRAIPATAPPGALVIEITGHQWWWEVRYPEEGITTRNLMHIPVGRPVELRLRSADVIHSFWVPALGGKLDMLPDHTNVLVLEADEPGAYRGQCAEFCGLHHTTMEFVALAQSPEEFADWVARQREAALVPAARGGRADPTATGRGA